ncbi:MAG: phosphoribosylamine--glycine ligase, partial [Patescibacteria group bacterium]
MKLHIVGAGGRAHASVWKLAELDCVTSIVCAPGNAGISMERLRNDEAVRCVPVLP